jgi:hypothetical protein
MVFFRGPEGGDWKEGFCVLRLVSKDTYGIVVSSFVSDNMSQTTLMCTQCVIVELLTDYEYQCIWFYSVLCFRSVSYVFQVVMTWTFTHPYDSHTRVHDSYYSSSCTSSQCITVYKSLVLKTKPSSLVFLTITIKSHPHLLTLFPVLSSWVHFCSGSNLHLPCAISLQLGRHQACFYIALVPKG